MLFSSKKCKSCFRCKLSTGSNVNPRPLVDVDKQHLRDRFDSVLRSSTLPVDEEYTAECFSRMVTSSFVKEMTEALNFALRLSDAIDSSIREYEKNEVDKISDWIARRYIERRKFGIRDK